MSEFITHRDYAKYEHLHAGWKESIGIITGLIGPWLGERSHPRLFEFGPGPGTSTRAFVKQFRDKWGHGRFEINCVDNDPASIRELERQVIEHDLCEVKPTLFDALELKPETRYDACISIFAVSHLRDPEKTALFEQMTRLSELGLSVISDEFLPAGLPPPTAYWHHHSAVIFDAVLAGNVELARIELEALYSGLHGIGDFKLTTLQFERMVESIGLRWIRMRCFPLTGDLTPGEGAKNNEERQAQAIWKQHELALFELVRQAPAFDRLFPPAATYSLLDQICELLSQSGLLGMRSANHPSEEQLKWKRDADTSESAWGVFVYALTKPEAYAELLRRVSP